MAAPGYTVALTFTPTEIYNPTFPVTGIAASVTITNTGSNLVYVGGSEVTQETGMPLPPGSKPLKIVNAINPLYAVESVTLGAAIATTATATLPTNRMAPGLSSIPTTTTGAVTGLVPGTTFAIGNTVNSSNLEFATVASSVATTVVTATIAYPHIGGEAIYSTTLPVYGSVVTVSPGVL